MMNILYLDTSQNILIAGVLKGAENFPRTVDAGKSGHTRILMGEIDAALKAAGLDISDIDAVAAVMGPGSFTGIRIGISAAKGFALAEGKPLLPLTSFELIAYNVDCEDFFAVVDAAHGHSYACRFTGGAPGAPAYVSDEELVASGLPLYGFEERALPRACGAAPI